MSARDGDEQGWVLAVVAGVVAGVLALVLGLAIASLKHPVVPAPAGVAEASIDFAPGEDQLPDSARDVLSHWAEQARRDQSRVLITAYRSMGSAGSTGATLSTRRADRVHHALQAEGLAPDQLLRGPSVAATGALANRVELRLQ